MPATRWRAERPAWSKGSPREPPPKENPGEDEQRREHQQPLFRFGDSRNRTRLDRFESGPLILLLRFERDRSGQRSDELVTRSQLHRGVGILAVSEPQQIRYLVEGPQSGEMLRGLLRFTRCYPPDAGKLRACHAELPRSAAEAREQARQLLRGVSHSSYRVDGRDAAQVLGYQVRAASRLQIEERRARRTPLPSTAQLVGGIEQHWDRLVNPDDHTVLILRRDLPGACERGQIVLTA